MCKGILGKKLGMTSYFSSEGKCWPVTVLQVGPCAVTQIKRKITDGYDAIQLGFDATMEKRVNNPIKGHLAKCAKGFFKVLREFPVDKPDDYELGQFITVDLFKVGERIDISGLTKGRGFAGVIKRHGFHGGKKTHGSHSHRIPGSIGCSAWPSKVIKGKKMPGHYGNVKRTVRNLEVVDIRSDENLLLIKGAVPGPNTGVVSINKLKFS